MANIKAVFLTLLQTPLCQSTRNQDLSFIRGAR